jgi:hypothetical protein
MGAIGLIRVWRSIMAGKLGNWDRRTMSFDRSRPVCRKQRPFRPNACDRSTLLNGCKPWIARFK